MASGTTVTLTAGNLRLQLSPSVGGAISAFEWGAGSAAKPILRPCNEPLENVLAASSFPLVPYVNRVRNGCFTFRGREVRLQRNMPQVPQDPSPLHGQGWLGAWNVESSNASTAVLGFGHEPSEWPWAYEARQQFSLDERGLSLRIECRNLSADAMPCGLGQHPYFPCGPETRIDTQAEVAWTIDEKVLPVDKVRAEGRYDLRDRLVCGQDLDNGWGGWAGSARLTDPDWPYELELSSPEAKFFQVYSPPSGGIFVAEPVSHANAALNAPEQQWPELGMRVLQPGESMSLDMRLEVIAK